MLEKATMHNAVLAIALGSLSIFLQGCDFSTSGETCNGDSCNCYVNYYGMEANLYIGGTPIEHSSRRIMVSGVAKDTTDGNKTDCCLSINRLFASQIQGQPVATADLSSFSKACVNSTNKEVASAAKRGSVAPSPALATSRFLTASLENVIQTQSIGSPATGTLHSTPFSDDYEDCDVEFAGANANLTLNGVHLKDVQSNFIIRWTDRKTSSEKSCCKALQPLVHALFVEGGAPSDADKQRFCSACKDAYNTGVALAAYRGPCGDPQGDLTV